MIKLKRVYNPAVPKDGTRFLVERLWPRGVKKSALQMDDWVKEAAPSTELRRWFAHDPEKWNEFRRRYFSELLAKPEVLEPIIKATRRGVVTLLYSSHDEDHNNAGALKDFLETKRGRKRNSRKIAA